MAGYCFDDYQLWIHGHRDSRDFPKLPAQGSKKPIAVYVSGNSNPADRHGLCVSHLRHAVELCVYRGDRHYVVSPDVSEDYLFKMIL